MSASNINYNAISDPASWASTLLQYMSLPDTDANVQFLINWAQREGGNWENTAHFNPLNTTQQEPGSTVMSGGNSAGVQSYSSWQVGIQATAQTLGGYPQIVQALQSGNPWPANNSGSLGGELQEWSGNGYTSVSSGASNYGATTGGTAGGTGPTAETGSTAATPAVPGMNDIPGLIQYINQNDPSFAWLIQIPSVATVLEQAVANQDSTAQIQAAIEQTAWWKTTSQAVKTYEQNVAQAPADYGPQAFGIPGSAASQTLAQVKAAAAQYGVTINGAQAQELATNFMKFGWTTQQLQQAVGALASPATAPSVEQNLNQIAAQYYQTPSSAAMQTWIQNVAAGTQTTQQFQAQMAQDAAMKWTGYAPQLQAGYTMNQLTDNLRTQIAQTLAIDPTDVNFTSNQYAPILDYAPPGDNGQHRVMTQSEALQYVKSTPSFGYQYTQGARDSAASLEHSITQAFGKVGG